MFQTLMDSVDGDRIGEDRDKLLPSVAHPWKQTWNLRMPPQTSLVNGRSFASIFLGFQTTDPDTSYRLIAFWDISKDKSCETVRLIQVT